MTTRSSDRLHAVILTIMGLAVAVLVAATVFEAWDLYRTPLAERAAHPDFRRFRPAGDIGHGLGILGSAMILLLLLYSVRKRSRRLQRAGSLKTWLRYHIFLGVAGPVLITLHTSFKVEGLVALSYWSMVAVALSGVLGRYLYQQLPRNVLGEEMDPGAAESRREELLVTLSERTGLDEAALDRLEDLAVGSLEGRSAPVALFLLPWLNATTARALQGFRDAKGQALAPEDRDLARRWVLLTRRVHLFHTIRDLFHWWHVLHKPFAVIMILIMIVHVGVAVALGYTWVW
ncbi:MAG TPA: hypothetical protein PLH84_14215 [Candidatus Krumholzibacteria bacterium]|nr:hypothetical protein [Candidatus Krumholzibacteria bacterium]